MDEKIREILTSVLLDSIAETQKRSGRLVQPMSEETIPLLDLDGFDSHNGVEVEVLLSIRLGIEIEKVPFCAGKRGSKELKVKEIVSALASKYSHALSAFSDKKAEELVAN